MDRPISFALGATWGVAALLLGGCAAPGATDWNRVSVRDQHQNLPAMLKDTTRPTVVVTAGQDGMVVAGPNAPGTRMVMADGQLRLVSEETFARLQRDAQTNAMGAPASPAPAR